MSGEKADVIAMLNEDIRGEHAAIVQYLRHAYALGEGELACEIEEIAREEMRHMKWLSEMVVELGGDPTLDRGKMDLGGPVQADMMRRDVGLEEMAIDLYQQHIEAIEDERIKKLLLRIVSDEEAHREDFKKMVEEVGEEVVAVGGELSETQKRDIAMLNEGVRHEYTTALQYVRQAFVAPDREIAWKMEDAAQVEMKHIGWLAERAVELGGDPDIERETVDLSETTEAMMKANIEDERAAIVKYQRHTEEMEDPKAKELIERVQYHEVRHGEEFKEYLERVTEKKRPKPATPTGLTVGSLIERKSK